MDDDGQERMGHSIFECIAEPGGIWISSSAFDHVRGKVPVEFADLGEQNLKNIDRPVRAYAVVRDGSVT
jgi:class 3 adenylate cyclase